jgi:hypothetical protein
VVNAHSRRLNVCKSVAFALKWKQFIIVYERFTDLLCAAAKNGCNDQVETEYRTIRKWIVSEYFRLSATLRPYLVQISPGPHEEKAVQLPRRVQVRLLDPLEAVFTRGSLRDILDADDGGLIVRISQVSEAVYRCNDERRGNL